MFLALAIGLSCIYRFGPSREAPRWTMDHMGQRSRGHHVDCGICAVFLLRRELRTFNETYGSLGAAIGFMTWLWISAIAILLGAELNAEMEHQTARDTTTGEPKPLGARGAKMADTLGAAR